MSPFEFAARARARHERLEKRIPLLDLGAPYSVVVCPSEIRSMAVRSLRNEEGKFTVILNAIRVRRPPFTV